MTIWVDASGWPVPPFVLLGCVVAGILYIRGWMTLAQAELTRNAARARMSPASVGARIGGYQGNSWLWRGIFFVLALFVALVGDSAPIDILSGRLFWVHMVQHLLLLVVMARCWSRQPRCTRSGWDCRVGCAGSSQRRQGRP